MTKLQLPDEHLKQDAIIGLVEVVAWVAAMVILTGGLYGLLRLAGGW